MNPKLIWFNLSDPGQREAVLIIMASLLASGFFWAISLLTHLNASSSLMFFSLSSALDVSSSLYVLWRFSKPDALTNTPSNVAMELRASVIVAFAFIFLALMAISFSSYALGAEIKPRWDDLCTEILLALPSQAIYLVIGMLQLQIGSRLRSTSLTKDGVLSVFSALAGIVQLTGAEIDVFTTKKFSYEAGWWWDPILSIVIACLMLAYGAHALSEETRLGARWWTPSFWTRRTTPGDEAAATAERAESGQGVKGEASRLVKDGGEREIADGCITA